jgi:uncharacterized protein YjdB
MKKVTLLLFSLIGFSLNNSFAHQWGTIRITLPKFIPINSQHCFDPLDFVEPADSALLYDYHWESHNSHISITSDGIASTSNNRGEGSISLKVTRWDPDKRQHTEVHKILNRKIQVSNPFTLTNQDDSLLVLSWGDTARLSILSSWKDGLSLDPEDTIIWRAQPDVSLRRIVKSGDPQESFLARADSLGVTVVHGLIASSPNMKVSSILYIVDSISFSRHIFVPLGQTRKVEDPQQIGLASFDEKDFNLTWFNPYTHIVTVNEDNILEGKQPGTDTLIVTVSSIRSSVNVKVIVHVVDFKFLNDGARLMGKDSKDSFHISLLPDAPEFFDTRIRWELYPGIQSQQILRFYQRQDSDVDTSVWKKTELVSTSYEGDAYLIASLVADPDIRDTCLVKVSNLSIEPLAGGPAIVATNETLQLGLFPGILISPLPEVRWIADPNHPDIASVDDNGLVKGLKPGYAVITAIAKNNATWRGSVIVQVSDLKIDYVGAPVLRPGDELYLTLRGIPPYLVAWASSQNDIVSVDDNGTLKAANKFGAASITASLKNKTDITRTLPVYVSRILLNKTGTLHILPNTSLSLEASVEPAALTHELQWTSSDPAVATVDNNGHVLTLANGYTSIIASLTSNQAVRASCLLKVGIPAQALTVSSTHTGPFQRGKGYQFSVSVQPANANALIQWTSDNNDIVSIDKLGWMTAKAVGSTRIAATDEHSGIYHFYDVTVNEPQLGLFLNAVALDLREEDSYRLQTFTLPHNADYGTIQWRSSNNQVVSVTEETGVIYARQHGEAFITAKAGNDSAVCHVIVSHDLDSIFLNHDTIDLDRNTGANFPLSLSFIPLSAANFYDIQWTSLDEDIASVVNGLVTPHKEGQTKIIARVDDGRLHDECIVNVIVPLRGLTLNHDSLVIQKGEVVKLLTTVEPADVTAAQRQFFWHSSDESVASVSQGSVEGLLGGTSLITVTTLDGKFADSCFLTVETPASGFSLQQHTLSLDKGDKQWILYSIFPDNATFRNLSWSSTNPAVADVNEQGVVSAIASGKAVIHASTQGFTTFADSCIVTVDNPITNLVLPNQIILEQGAEYTLAPATSPQDATPQLLDWNTDDRRVATVSNGLVKAVYKGTAIVSASTDDGAAAQTAIIVKVYSGGLLLEGVTSVRPGFDFTIVARLFPSNASDQQVHWSFSLPSGTSTSAGTSTSTSTSAAAAASGTSTSGSSAAASGTSNIAELIDKGNLHCTLRGKNPGQLIIQATSADGKVSQSHTVTILPTLTAPPTSLSPFPETSAPYSPGSSPYSPGSPSPAQLPSGTLTYSTPQSLLLINGLNGFQATIFSLYGQPIASFPITADPFPLPLSLPPALYIFSASKPNTPPLSTKFLSQ